MKRYVICALAALLLTALTGSAQWPIVRNFATDEYGGGTQTWSIAQLNDERMIFGNNNGLLFFDGNAWQMHEVENKSIVYATFYDHESRRIYVGAQNEFGYFYFDSHGALRYRKLSHRLPEICSNFGEIWRIHRLYSVVIFESKNYVFIVTPDGEIEVRNVPERIEHCTVIDGTMIIACREHIYYLNEIALEIMPATEKLRGEVVRAILPFTSPSRGKGVLFVTADSGLWFSDGSSTEPYDIDRDIPAPDNIEITPTLRRAQVFCAAICSEYIAFGTVRSGLVLKSLKNGSVMFSGTSSGMQNNTVLSLAFDDDLNIWLGLDNGIDYMILNAPVRNLLSSDDVNHLGTGYASLIHGNYVYLGTNQGLFCYNRSQSPFNRRIRQVEGFNGQVWILREIGNTVLCGADAGAFVVTGEKVQRIADMQGTWDFKPLAGHSDLVLACDYQGFKVLRRTAAGVEVLWRIAGTDVSSNLYDQDADGSLWVNHWQKGVYRFELSRDFRRVVDTQFFDGSNCLPSGERNLICKINGKVYVSAVDGFYTYNHGKRRLEKDKAVTSIFGNNASTIKVKQLPGGDLWGYNETSLYYARLQPNGHYHTDSVSTRRFINRLQNSLGDIGIADDRHTIFNCEKGFYVMNNTLRSNESPKKLIIRSVVSTLAPDSVLYSSQADSVKHLDVPHHLNSLMIEFVLPYYGGKNNVEYSCRLEGFDKQWSAPQTACTKEYTQLSKGSYTFRVRAHNLVTGEVQETSLEIHVWPAWYETWWATLLWTVLLGVGIFFVYKYLRRRADRELRRAKREQEQQLREQQAQFQIKEEKRRKELAELRNNQLEVELKHKSSELADSIMNLVRKNDMIQEIDALMEELSDTVKHEDRKSIVTKKISDIRRGIRMNINDDDNWEKFIENFNMVYDNFMKELTTRFPDLKKNDLKLCAYLRMGLSSKEMASLLNTSVRSIETARYRLRRKLSLDQGANLTAFIQDLEGAKK
ncbi:MAG: triple tyrosine motif-containing protein [Muribaculaceae bacterium]